MNVNRRGFLRALFAAPLIAPLAGLLPVKYLSPETLDALYLRPAMYALAKKMDAEAATFASYHKIGDTITIRKPARFRA